MNYFPNKPLQHPDGTNSHNKNGSRETNITLVGIKSIDGKFVTVGTSQIPYSDDFLRTLFKGKVVVISENDQAHFASWVHKHSKPERVLVFDPKSNYFQKDYESAREKTIIATSRQNEIFVLGSLCNHFIGKANRMILVNVNIQGDNNNPKVKIPEGWKSQRLAKHDIVQGLHSYIQEFVKPRH